MEEDDMEEAYMKEREHNEAYMKEREMEEDLYEQEGEDDLGEPKDDTVDEPMDMDDPEESYELDQEDVDFLSEAGERLASIAAKLGGAGEAMDEPMDEPMDMDEPPEKPEDKPPAGDEDVLGELEDVLSEVDLDLTEDEVVQEVTRRVAKRIVKAKQAQKNLDEALGRKPKRSRFNRK